MQKYGLICRILTVLLFPCNRECSLFFYCCFKSSEAVYDKRILLSLGDTLFIFLDLLRQLSVRLSIRFLQQLDINMLDFNVFIFQF
ncbi:hypothetical protein ATZ36_01125 [Candidatus Endomicrobiellum trichonymphae]|uniref:Uncharacterized protein n=1 Tax=Endomicrobium trichonymphae TaxID=1408204 RepID=A0A1E5IIV1_ENDTX|nr:hypothetical protein ATZ36_01125 [Candidatus Endomicrobium trichonymphae]